MQVKVWAAIDVVTVNFKLSDRDLLGHNIGGIVFTLKPVWLDNSSCYSFSHYMKADSYMFLGEIRCRVLVSPKIRVGDDPLHWDVASQAPEHVG